MEFPFPDLHDLAAPTLSFISDDPAARLIGHASQTSRSWRDFGAGPCKIVLFYLNPRDVAALKEAVSAVRLDWVQSVDIRLQQAKELSEAIPSSWSLDNFKLVLEKDAIDGGECEKFAQALPRCASKNLALDFGRGNVIGVEGCKAIAEALPKVQGLKDLRLNLVNNAVKNGGCMALAEVFPKVQ